MKINNNELHNIVRSLWESESKQDKAIDMIAIFKDFNNTIIYKVYYMDNTSEQKPVPSEFRQLLETTSAKTIIIQYDIYSVETDLFTVIYDFNGKIIGTEEA